jgi:aryl-alcohol dehydrogenase-like predicted oxidoreductase
MPLDHYVTLGNSGLRVSPFALGTMTFGDDLGWGSPVPDSEAILRRYLEAGGNFVDTANVYTRGHSEKIIGDFFKREPRLRQRCVLATKFYGTLFPGDPNGGGAGRKAILEQVDESLRRLQTDHIDLYWMHVWDPYTPIEETLRTLDDLVHQGKVRYLGFSDTPAWKLAQAQTLSLIRGFTPLIALQIEYSLLERTVEYELIPAARELGLGVTPWGPLKGGALSGKYTRENHGKVEVKRGAFLQPHLQERTYALVDLLVKIGKELDTSPSRVALAWVQNRPGVASSIIGARTLDQLEDNFRALEVKLTPAQLKALDDASKPPFYALGRFLAPPYSFAYGGTTVNGVSHPQLPMSPKNDQERY